VTLRNELGNMQFVPTSFNG